MSGYVALRLPLPGVVVTYFVTGSRAFSLRNTGSSVLPNPQLGRTYSAMTGYPGAGTRIGERTFLP